MNLATKTIVSEIITLLDKAKSFPETYKTCDKKLSGSLYTDIQYFITRVKYIFTNTPKVDPSFIKKLDKFSFSHLPFTKNPIHSFDEDLLRVTACLLTLKMELENNLLFDISELINAEVFESHLEYAKYLLDKGHKDASAVIIGGVLEDKLRQMCIKQNLPLKDSKDKYLTIDPMNVNLYKNNVYNLTVQKQILAFAEIRNNAAHGKYDEYTPKQVSAFYDYVLDFNN